MNNIAKTIAFSALLSMMSTLCAADLYIWDGTSNDPIIVKEAELKIKGPGIKEKYVGYTIVEAPADFDVKTPGAFDVKTFSVKEVPSTSPTIPAYTVETIETLPSEKNYIIYKNQ